MHKSFLLKRKEMYKSFLLKRKSIIYNELKSLGLKLSKDSLYLWLDYACNIFLFHKVPKYTRSLVKERSMPAKYYVADVGLYNAVLLSQSEDEGKALENIVCLMIERTLERMDECFISRRITNAILSYSEVMRFRSWFRCVGN